MTTTTRTAEPILTEEMLLRFRERAPQYDRENRFFDEDFEELKAAGYLKLAVPRELGGFGMTLAEVGREQRRLARYAAPDALAVNMHLYWTGVAADLLRAGDDSCRWMLEEAAAGEIFAAGHAEHGNDVAVLYGTTSATPDDGGYRINGRKAFGTLTPVWTRLGIHAQDNSDPAAPKIVHAFLPRDSEGIRIEETWDALGMRATRSDDTILENVFAPQDKIARVLPAGSQGMDLFVLSLFAWALGGFANVYCGLASRALEASIEHLQSRTSVAIPRGGYKYHPEFQHGLAEMVVLNASLEPLVESVTQGWSDAIGNAANWAPEDAGGWGLKFIAAKKHIVESAFKVADMAVELAGGFGVARKSEFERLFRDARMGRIHPANTMLANEFLAKMTLGVEIDANPRWS